MAKASLPLCEVDFCLLADEIGKTSANAADVGQCEHDLLLPIDVGIENAQNVLKVVFCYERLRGTSHESVHLKCPVSIPKQIDTAADEVMLLH